MKINQWIRFIISSMLVILLLFSLNDSFIKAENGTENNNELIIKLKKDQKSLTENRTLEQADQREQISDDLFLFKFDTKIDIDSIQEELESDPLIEYSEPNFERNLQSTVNDPYFEEQWWIPHINTQSIWEHSHLQKDNIVIAVIDTGIDQHHEDLAERIAPGGYNFYSNNTNFSDYHGHGTNVSGVIAAQFGNNLGISGVTGPFDISVLPLKVTSTDTVSVADIIKAIDYAVEQNVDIVNLSLSGTDYSTSENNIVQHAIDSGINVVAAAGNDAEKGNPLMYPASYDNVISVGSVDEFNQRSSFSNYNNKIDIVAPGENILTTSLTSNYKIVQGTSFSTPIVAGTIGMIKALKPDLSVLEINDLITNTATDLGSPGYNSFYGHGLLNIEQIAMQLNPSETKIPVTGVELDRNYIFIDNEKEINSHTVSDNNLLKLNEISTSNNIYYEQEPNDTFETANLFNINDAISGTITDHYSDIDYYKFKIDQDGMFSLLGDWVDNAGLLNSDARYLAINLYDEQHNLINTSFLEQMPSGNYGQYLEQYLEKGTYYLSVFQTSSYQYIFTDEQYLIVTIYEPDEEKPDILFDKAFMKTGENKPFVSHIHSESKFETTDQSVAKVNPENGIVEAIGYGKTTVSHTVGEQTHTATIKVSDETELSTTALFEEVLPNNATNKNVSWKSSNKDIATVDQYGIITAKANGKATVTVTTEDGNYEATATIEVEGHEKPDPTTKAANGFYNLETLTFTPLQQFIQLSRNEKVTMLFEDLYIVIEDEVIETEKIITETDAGIQKALISLEEFEQLHGVTLTEDGEIIIND